MSVLLLATSASNRTANTPIQVVVLPSRPLIERGGGNQYLNFDLIVANQGKRALRLTNVEVSVYDRKGKLAIRKFVDQNGFQSGLATVVTTQWPGGATRKLYNPFVAFDTAVSIGTMQYRFRFVYEGSQAEVQANRHRLPIDFDVEAEATVSPVDYPGKTDLVLPLAGRLIVFDGHDFYAHHRRQATGLPGLPAKNPVRYAYDLLTVDSATSIYTGSPYGKEHWTVYGADVSAPGTGIVVAATNTIAENEFRGRTVVPPRTRAHDDPEGLGNHVIIDHGNGEYSYLLHLKTGSVRVKKGDRVAQGQVIGQVGFSGDAFIPHLHYMVADGPVAHDAEGLPSYFSNFERIAGSHRERVGRGHVDSGDILERVVPR